MKNYNTKICYVVNFWLGERRIEVDYYKSNKLFFLNRQIDFLTNKENNIDTIFFNFNIVPQHYSLISEIFKIVPKKINNSLVEVTFRENIGMSYGAFSDIFKSNLNRFDYYIFNEDDYVFTQDNWDEYLVKKFNSKENCGYLSMIVADTDSRFPKHASHSTGISSYKVLQEVINKNGELPHPKNDKYNSNEIDGQVKQTNEIYKLGYELYDVREDYCVLFLNHVGNIVQYHDTNKKILIKPAHLYE